MLSVCQSVLFKFILSVLQKFKSSVSLFAYSIILSEFVFLQLTIQKLRWNSLVIQRYWFLALLSSLTLYKQNNDQYSLTLKLDHKTPGTTLREILVTIESVYCSVEAILPAIHTIELNKFSIGSLSQSLLSM